MLDSTNKLRLLVSRLIGLRDLHQILKIKYQTERLQCLVYWCFMNIDQFHQRFLFQRCTPISARRF
jgi:hypothetical protein